jgi:hypothetical protein
VRSEDRIERDRYRVHQTIYDFPSKRSFWAFLTYSRWPIMQLGWLMWASWWAGFSLSQGHMFTFWLNLAFAPIILLITLLTWHRHVVWMSKTMLLNLQEIGRWLRHNGYDKDDPPSWLH